MEKSEVLIWVIYDIVKNRTRNKVVKFCKEAGLYRVQKSVFLGKVRRNRLDELRLQCEEIMDEHEDSIYIFPLCEKDFRSVILLGQAFDKKMINDEVKALFL